MLSLDSFADVGFFTKTTLLLHGLSDGRTTPACISCFMACVVNSYLWNGSLLTFCCTIFPFFVGKSAVYKFVISKSSLLLLKR